MATAVTPSSVVRTILTADINLSADDVIQRAKAKGVTAPAEKVRALVHTLRSEMKKAAGASKRLAVPPKPAASSKALPVPVKAAASSKALPVPAKPAASSKALPLPTKPAASSKALLVPTKPAASSKALPIPPATPGADVAAVLANVSHVHRVALACGSIEAARQAAEAVRACGGVEGFLQHLDLVAGLQQG
ncbi:MAG TPA: hypothetical protein VM597_39490 [Gemmataceae bacterium]|nr:hypothetical protein [Gemmataceae bacterium]